MNAKKIAGLLAGFVLVVAVAGAGYWLLLRSERDTCGVCRRPIHQEARAVIEADGKREPVCCARCALTLARQQNKPVRLLEVTDYSTGKPILPDSAVFVEGSRMILCEKDEPMFADNKSPQYRHFDRCIPSLYAFARRADAEEFAQQYGGVVRSLAEISQGVKAQP